MAQLDSVRHVPRFSNGRGYAHRVAATVDDKRVHLLKKQSRAQCQGSSDGEGKREAEAASPTSHGNRLVVRVIVDLDTRSKEIVLVKLPQDVRDDDQDQWGRDEYCQRPRKHAS